MSITAEAAARPSGARTQTTIAIERLRTDIVTGKLRPNEKLRVQALAERYCVAASSLREALSRLVTDGLVVAEDQRGFRVSPVSRADLLDLTEARVGIDCLALARAIEFGDVGWESEILGAYHRLSRCQENGDPSSPEAVHWGACHDQFHRALIAGCRSEWLMYFSRLMYEKSDRYRMLVTFFARPPSSRNPRAEHEAMMNAAIKRDKDEACRLLSEHYRETTRLLLAVDQSVTGL
jgi:DNA-binding GntR family transcriptional regulator